jgi:molecular chaperone IbpA
MNVLPYEHLLRRVIGFDPRFSDLPQKTFPHYDITQGNPDSDKANKYWITVAVAGYSRENIDISVADGILKIVGTKPPENDKVVSIHQGIAMRDFTCEFRMLPDIKLVGAELSNGLLEISLERVIPDAAKPVRIEIK